MVGLADIPFLGKLVERVSDKAVDAVFRGFRYVFRYKAVVEQLNSETEKLKIQKDNISEKINQEKASGKIIKDHVLKWQKDVEEIQKSPKELSPSCGCIQSLPIPNPVSRFRLGRNAAKKAIVVAQLTSTGKDHLTAEIARRPPVQNMPKPDTAYEEFESRKDVYKKLWDALVNEDGPLIHGIYGMAGVGKTRMMEKIWKDAIKDKIFKNVVRVNVGSENLKEYELQDQIAGHLECKLESQDVERRASQLEYSLRNAGKILLILDDVWREIPLNNFIGTPFGDGGSPKGSKILFTSREIVVLKRNKCEHLVEIKTLSSGEDLNLFKNTVGPDTINSLQDESLVQKVCDECGHLPLLIHAVGKALKGESEISWKDAHNQLKFGKFENIAGVEPKVYTCIKLSIDMLKQSDAKLCLFLCSLFPEDAIIDMKMLVQLATGSGLIHSDAGELRVLKMVDSLKASSLLLDSGRHNGTKVHDIIRDVARSMACTDSKYGFLHEKCNSRYFPSDAGCFTEKLLRLDVETNDVHFKEDPVWPQLHTLWLQSNYHPQKFSGGFFRMFANLSSLMLQNVNITLEHFSLQPLGNLRTLTLVECNIEKTDVSLFPKNLKMLCISGCLLPWPLDVANLEYLRKLEIRKYRSLLIAPNVISSLSSLEELHIPVGFNIEGEEYQMDSIVTEISKLTHLRSLKFSFPVVNTFQSTNAFSSLDRYNLNVGVQNLNIRWSPSMRSIRLNGNHTQPWEGLLARAEEVRLEKSDVEVSSICNGHRRAFQDLKSMYIFECHNMGHLASISQDEIQHEATCFSKLTSLSIRACSNLKYLFCNNIAKSLVQLQKLSVSDCESMEAVIINEGARDDGGIINLKSLTIASCPRLASFYAQNAHSGSALSVDPSAQHQPLFDGQVSFPSLEELEIRSLPTSVIWGKDCYNDKLNRLSVSRCDKLEIVIPQAMLHRLNYLESIEVNDCRSLRSMFQSTCQSGKANTCKVPVRLLQLRSIRLENLPVLNSFFHGTNFEFHVPALTDLQVIDCGLSTLFTVSMFRNFQLEKLIVWNCELLENIVEDLRGDETCKKIITLSQLTEVALKHLPKLKSCFHNANYEFHMPVLEKVKVYSCGLSNTLFTRSTFKNLEQLKELKVRDCELLESFFEEARADESPDTSDMIITLNQVSKVSLRGLPKFKSIFCGATYECYMPALKYVIIDGCGLSVLFTFSVFRELQQLEELNVYDCESLEHIVEEVRGAETSEINGKSIKSPKLSSVTLDNLPNLKSCFHNANYEFHIPALKEVFVDNCGLSNALFTRSVFKNLKQLKQLSVLNCELLESIFENARADENPDTSDKIITLNQVSKVYLKGLPKLESIFYGATYQCYMPALKYVKIVGCGLSVLFTFSVFRELQQLKKLHVSDCESLEYIVEEVGLDETSEITGRSITFSKLYSITLKSLPDLKSFSSPSYVFNMPILCTLKLRKCPKMEYFSSSKINTEAVRVTMDGCSIEGIQGLNDYIRQKQLRGSYSSDSDGESSYSSQQLETQSDIEEGRTQKCFAVSTQLQYWLHNRT